MVRSGKRKEVSCFSQHTIKYMIIRCLAILVHRVTWGDDVGDGSLLYRIPVVPHKAVAEVSRIGNV